VYAKKATGKKYTAFYSNCSTLKMESVNLFRTTRRHIPEDNAAGEASDIGRDLSSPPARKANTRCLGLLYLQSVTAPRSRGYSLSPFASEARLFA
jgi:hypothetical protein